MNNGNAPRVSGRVSSANPEDRNQWFLDHLENPVNEISEFLSGTNLTFSGARVLDVGCGDGFIDLGVVRRLNPSKLVGVDFEMPNIEELRTLSKTNLGDDLPHNLSFGTCTATTIPLPDESFDVVMSWSVFEHVSNPVAVMSEIKRILRPGGFMFLQIWPLYMSQRGSHLWNWYPEGWEHLLSNHDDLRSEMSQKLAGNPDLHAAMNADFDTLNRLTLQDLQRAISSAGLKIRRLSLQSDLIDIPEPLLRYSLADLAISGVKLLATR